MQPTPFHIRFLGARSALIGLVLAGAMAAAAIWGTFVPKERYDHHHVRDKRGEYIRHPASPGEEFAFGSDLSGRSVFWRVIRGAHFTLRSGLAAVLIALFLGAPIGLLCGYFGGWLDTLAMRAMDFFLAFPALLLALALMTVLRSQAPPGEAVEVQASAWRVFASAFGGVFAALLAFLKAKDWLGGGKPAPWLGKGGLLAGAGLGALVLGGLAAGAWAGMGALRSPDGAASGERNLTYAIIAIGIVYTPHFARVIRSTTLQARSMDYVQACRVTGASTPRIIFRHILPNTISPTIVLATTSLSGAILEIAALSFLGLGAADEPEWGRMMSEAASYWQLYPHIMVFPGVALSLSVFGINLLGDGLRDALDVRLRD